MAQDLDQWWKGLGKDLEEDIEEDIEANS